MVCSESVNSGKIGKRGPPPPLKQHSSCPWVVCGFGVHPHAPKIGLNFDNTQSIMSLAVYGGKKTPFSSLRQPPSPYCTCILYRYVHHKSTLWMLGAIFSVPHCRLERQHVFPLVMKLDGPIEGLIKCNIPKLKDFLNQTVQI